MTPPTRFLVLLLSVTANLPTLADDLDRADRLLRDGETKKAAELYRRVTEEDESNALAWFQLAYSLHELGDHDAAIAANRKCAEFPLYRPTALYNLACGLAATSDLDGAEEALEQAMDAGYLDFDQLFDDPDLDALRARRTISFPSEHEFVKFEGRNGVAFSYHVVLPVEYDAKRAYPAIVVFAPGQGKRRAADWVLEELLGEETKSAGRIVVVPTSPDRGWINHPSHHALEDLLKEILRSHRIKNQTFHLVGFGDGGRAALTYSSMSRRYVRALSLLASTSSSRWSDHDLGGMRGLGRVNVIAGADDSIAAVEVDRLRDLLESAEIPFEARLVEGNGRLLRGMRGATLLEAIGESGLARPR